MNSPEERWWSVRAGEYVLGTLRGEDRSLFEKILAHDTAIQAEVERWEQDLVVLNQTASLTVPKLHLWPNILLRIRQLDHTDPMGSGDTDPAEPNNGSVASAHQQTRTQTRLWPMVAGLAIAVSLVLTIVILQGMLTSATKMHVDGLAVVLSDEGRVPYYLVETDYENGQVRVTALSPPPLEEAQNFQLWQAMPDRSAVRLVTLLPEDTGATLTLEIDSLIVGSDLFGVSIEPIGAPTNAGPTGPVVAHGDFLKTHSAY